MKYGFVAQRIADLTEKFDIKAIAFDQYRIKYLEPELEEASVSVPLIPHGQGYYKAKDSGLWMPHSIELFEELLHYHQDEPLSSLECGFSSDGG